jgi:hypothetical protein
MDLGDCLTIRRCTHINWSLAKQRIASKHKQRNNLSIAHDQRKLFVIALEWMILFSFLITLTLKL